MPQPQHLVDASIHSLHRIMRLLSSEHMQEERHTLSICVIAFNEARHVSRLQASVDALRRPAGVQVETILVDGGSSDGTAAAARAAGFTHVIECPGENIPVCRNRAAREASGDWLAYVDGDCELASDWLEHAYPLLTNTDQALLGWPARPPEPMNAMQAAWTFHWLNKNPRLEDFAGHRVVKEEGFRLATTRNMILHRSVFDAIDGFNENLPTGEDTDFAFRAYMHGALVLGVPDLRVTHHGEPATLRAFYRQQCWHANRDSYEHIVKLSGGKIGGNAPKYTAAFLGTWLLALIGAIAGPLIGARWFVVLVLPLLAVVSAPAAYISLKGRTPRHFPMLVVLYTLYGWARMRDMLGLERSKASWKSR